MVQKGILKTLMILLIMPYLLIGCQIEIGNSQEPANTTNERTVSHDVENSELTRAYNEFDTALQNWLKNLQEVVEKKRRNDSVDAKEINEKLEKLRQINNSLLAKTQIQKIKDAHDNINNTIKEIDNIIKPLNTGLEFEGIKKVQEFLKLPEKNDAVKRNLGKFGQITNNAIKEFLTDKNQQLSTDIKGLSQASSQKPLIPKPNTNKNEQNLQAEIKRLKENNQKLIFLIPIFIVIGGVMGAVGMFIYQKKRLEISSQQPNYNYPSTQVDSESSADTSPESFSPTHQRQPSREISEIQPSEPPRDNSTLHHNPPYSESVSYTGYNPGNQFTEVLETEDSINQRRLGTNQAAILEKVAKGKGNYWIKNEYGVDYLYPKDNIKITEYNYKTIAALFDCRNYQPGYSSEFKVLKPAKVAAISQKMWQLIERGVMQF